MRLTSSSVAGLAEQKLQDSSLTIKSALSVVMTAHRRIQRPCYSGNLLQKEKSTPSNNNNLYHGNNINSNYYSIINNLAVCSIIFKLEELYIHHEFVLSRYTCEVYRPGDVPILFIEYLSCAREQRWTKQKCPLSEWSQQLVRRQILNSNSAWRKLLLFGDIIRQSLKVGFVLHSCQALEHKDDQDTAPAWKNLQIKNAVGGEMTFELNVKNTGRIFAFLRNRDLWAEEEKGTLCSAVRETRHWGGWAMVGGLRKGEL